MDLQGGRETKKDALEIIRAYIRAIKPEVIVECGTYPGLATDSIAFEAKQYDPMFWTFERVPEYREQMKQMFAGLPVVKVALLPRPDTFATVDFTYLDSGPTYEDRIADLERWFDTAELGAVIAIDDTVEPWFDKYRAAAVVGDKSVRGRLPVFGLHEMPTTMGLGWMRHV